MSQQGKFFIPASKISGWVIVNGDYQDEIPEGRTAAIVAETDWNGTWVWTIQDHELNTAHVPSGSQVTLPDIEHVYRDPAPPPPPAPRHGILGRLFWWT